MDVKMSNKAPFWFQSFYTEFTTFKSNQEQFNKEVISRLDQVDSRLDNLEKDMKQVKQDIVLIKNCPTIKTELQQSN